MRYALVEDGIVVNVVLVDEASSYVEPEGVSLVSLEAHDEVGIGWTLSGSEWLDTRPEPEPQPGDDAW